MPQRVLRGRLDAHGVLSLCGALEMSAATADASGSAVDTRQYTELQFEWMHVQTPAGLPHILSISYHNLKHHDRAVPQCPLRFRDDHGFRYCVDVMDSVAQHLLPGLVYVGIVYDGPVPDYVRDLPHWGPRRDGVQGLLAVPGRHGPPPVCA